MWNTMEYNYPYLVFSLLLCTGSPAMGQDTIGGLCSVYEPFRVSPENAKFLFGGAFPLHTEDCLLVRPDTVQELVAFQWALTHWNQNPHNEHHKLAMQAGDTCSRPKEAVSQTINFLESAAHFQPSECFSQLKQPTLLGVIVPKDGASAREVGKVVEGFPLPLVAYNTPAALALAPALHTHTNTLFSTAPTLALYLQTVLEILSHLESDLVTVVVNEVLVGEGQLGWVREQLGEGGVVVERVVGVGDSFLGDLQAAHSPNIILTLISKMDLLKVLNVQKGSSLDKLWISIPVDGDVLSEGEAKVLFPHTTKGSLILLQQRMVEITEFRDYFLRTVRNNFESYALLASYMQQIHNCTLIGTTGFNNCKDLTQIEMAERFRQAPGVTSAILAAYTLAALGRNRLEGREGGEVSYTFSEYDPSIFHHFQLRFTPDHNNISVANSLLIEGLQLTHPPNSPPTLSRVVEVGSGDKGHILDSNFQWAEGRKIRSQCSQQYSACISCEDRKKEVDLSRYSLSLPRDYDLYLMGVFDLHDKDCLTPSSLHSNHDRLSLPLAFVHTIWTLKRRYSELHLLPGLQVGAIVVDSCSSESKALRSVLDAEEQCLLFPYGPSNFSVTVPPEKVVGYSFGGRFGVKSALKSILHEHHKPLITTFPSKEFLYESKELSMTPSLLSLSTLIGHILRQHGWNYISVFVSQLDPQSLEAYRQFSSELESKSVCVGETLRMSELLGRTTPIPLGSPVMVVFGTAEDAAQLFKYSDRFFGKTRKAVYILIGDAHNWQKGRTYLMEKTPYWESNGFGSVSVLPTHLPRKDYDDWLNTLTPQRFPESWFMRVVEEEFGCALFQKSQRRYGGRMCSGGELIALQKSLFNRRREVGYLAHSIESFLFALDAVYKNLCPLHKGLCKKFFEIGNQEIQKLLPTLTKKEHFQIYNLKMDKQTSQHNNKPHYFLMGNWSESQGLALLDPWVWYDENLAETKQLPESRCDLPLCRCYPDMETPMRLSPAQGAGYDMVEGVAVSPFSVLSRSRIERLEIETPSTGTKVWTYIFITINSLLLLMAMCVLLLVCVKLYYRVVKGNQSLGICLLCGVILLYVTGYFFIFPPSQAVCASRYFFHSFSYSLCFGVMIAKAIQLRNSETLGFNGFISYWNYWFLLFFAVGVQTALNVQWIFLRNPPIEYGVEGCGWSRAEFVVSQAYVLLLLLLTLFLSVLNRSIKRNYKETKWMFYTALIALPIWLTWILAYIFIPHPFHDTVVVMECVVCGTVILCFMFGPKLYILLSYEPVLIEFPPGYKSTSTQQDDETATRIDFLAGEEDEQRKRVESPVSSTHSTNLSSSGGEQSPVFQAVVRKKSRSKRIKANARPNIPLNTELHSPTHTPSTLLSPINMTST